MAPRGCLTLTLALALTVPLTLTLAPALTLPLTLALARALTLPLTLGYEVRERLRREDGAGGAFALLAIAHLVQSRLGPALLCCCCVYCWCRLSIEL